MRCLLYDADVIGNLNATHSCSSCAFEASYALGDYGKLTKTRAEGGLGACVWRGAWMYNLAQFKLQASRPVHALGENKNICLRH